MNNAVFFVWVFLHVLRDGIRRVGEEPTVNSLRDLAGLEGILSIHSINDALRGHIKHNLTQIKRTVAKPSALFISLCQNCRCAKCTKTHIGFVLLTSVVCFRRITMLKQNPRSLFKPQLCFSVSV